MGNYEQQAPPNAYYQQVPPQYYQPQQQSQYYQQQQQPQYYQQQPQVIYVQQPQQQSSNNADFAATCLGSLCVCLSFNLLLNACLFI